jgi:hypothetical protein
MHAWVPSSIQNFTPNFYLGADPINWSQQREGSLGVWGKRLGLVDTPSLPKELKKGRL